MWEKGRQPIFLVPILTLLICTVYLGAWGWGGSHVVYMILDGCWVEPEHLCSPSGRRQGILSPTVGGCWNVVFAYLWHCLQDSGSISHTLQVAASLSKNSDLSIVVTIWEKQCPFTLRPKASSICSRKQDVWFDSDWVLSWTFPLPLGNQNSKSKVLDNVYAKLPSQLRSRSCLISLPSGAVL